MSERLIAFYFYLLLFSLLTVSFGNQLKKGIIIGPTIYFEHEYHEE